MGVPNFNVKNKYDLKSTLLPVYLLFTSRKANKISREINRYRKNTKPALRRAFLLSGAIIRI
jgi:hypothetical protein